MSKVINTAEVTALKVVDVLRDVEYCASFKEIKKAVIIPENALRQGLKLALERGFIEKLGKASRTTYFISGRKESVEKELKKRNEEICRTAAQRTAKRKAAYKKKPPTPKRVARRKHLALQVYNLLKDQDQALTRAEIMIALGITRYAFNHTKKYWQGIDTHRPFNSDYSYSVGLSSPKKDNEKPKKVPKCDHKPIVPARFLGYRNLKEGSRKHEGVHSWFSYDGKAKEAARMRKRLTGLNKEIEGIGGGAGIVLRALSRTVDEDLRELGV